MSTINRRRFLGTTTLSLATAAASAGTVERSFDGVVFSRRRLDQARANVARLEWAHQRSEQLRHAAAPWKKLSLQELWELVPGPRLGRTIDVVMTRDYAARTTRRRPCPTCGQDRGYEVRPSLGRFTVFCTHCRDRFPKNDFGRFFQSARGRDGFFDAASGDRQLLVPETRPADGAPRPIVDEGSGWADGDGFVYRFVPYAVDQLWNGLIWGARDLADCWALTGDQGCARRAAVLLDRIADCYPDMDWAPWAQRGWYHSDGDSRRGKIFGRISESRVLPNLVRAYDQTLTFVAADDELHRFLKEQATRWNLPTAKGTPAAYRTAIEERLLRTGLRAIQDEQIRGNHGMHEVAAAWCAVALQDEVETRKWLDWVFAESGLRVPEIILAHMDRDGLGDEGAPAYSWGWGLAFHELAELLRLYGRYERWLLPRDFIPYRRSYTAAKRLALPDGRVPTLGDFGSCMETTRPPNDVNHLFEGFRLTRDPEIAAELVALHPDGDVCRDPFDDAPEAWPARLREAATKSFPPVPGGSFVPGFGLATLALPEAQGQPAVWIAFGRNRGHGHPDSLNLGLVAHGVDLLPDIGYPDFATRDFAKRSEWTSNTISHNTVVVDGRRQQPIWGGRTRLYKRLPQLGLGLMELESPAYSQTDLYRRTVALVQRPDGGAYCWDLFRVRGGSEHLQSWHGPEGEVQVLDAVAGSASQLDLHEASAYLTSRQRLDALPDKPLRLRYLSHPRWRADGAQIGLTLSVLGGSAVEATLAANRKPSIRTRVEQLDYLFLRSPRGAGPTLFSTLLVPDTATASPLPAEGLRLDEPAGSTAIRIDLGDGWSDTLAACGSADLPFSWENEHLLAGGFAWIRRRRGVLHSAFVCGGRGLTLPEGILAAQSSLTGTIEGFRNDGDGRLWVTCRADTSLPADLRGAVIRLGEHPQRDTAFEIQASQGNELNLGTNTTVTGFTDPQDFPQGFTHLCRPGQSWELVGHLFFNVEGGMRHGWGEVKLSQ